MAATQFNTKDEIIAEIVKRSGKSAEEAAAVYTELLELKKQTDLQSIYEFCMETHNGDEDAADIQFAGINLDTKVPNTGKPVISANASVNDVQGKQITGKTSSVSKTEYSRPVVGAGTDEAIKQLLSKESVDIRRANTEASSITTLLIQKPNPSTYLKKGDTAITVVPEIDADKLKVLEGQLVDTEENRKAFEVVKAAVINKTPMPVHVNDEGNKRVVGCIVSLNKETRTLNIHTLKAFLLTEVLGCIPGKPGVLLNKWEDRRVASSGGVNKRAASTTTVTMKWMGRDAAMREGRVEYISTPCSEKEAKARNFESHLDKGVRLRIDQAFKISVYSRRSDKHIERTKRLTGKADIPKFILKPQYKEYFQDTRRRDAVELPSTPDELQAALDTLDTGLAAIAVGDFKPTASMLAGSPALSEIVTKMRAAATQTPA